MTRKILWLIVSALMALSLVVAACSQSTAAPAPQPAPVTPKPQAAPAAPAPQPAPAEKEAAKPGADAPRYGGTLTLVTNVDPNNWDPARIITGQTVDTVYQQLWEGDWARGPAGGYGTKETDWLSDNDIWGLKAGFIAESWKWTADEAKDAGTLVYQIRRGMHWALNPASEASRLVNGREVTADDVAFNLKRVITESTAYLWGRNVELRTANITKTGPWEVTIKVPLSSLASAVSRFGDAVYIVPPEVVARYKDLQDWRNSVGSGAFMVTEFVPGSAITLGRNGNFWMKDPVGPGKGNQLPYLNGFRMLIIPDASTRFAALRTGKVDFMPTVGVDDADQLMKTAPKLQYVASPSNQGRGTPAFMRIDKPPFNDVRVRRAMNIAIDFKSILQNVYHGRGQIMSWPYSYVPDYADLVFKGPDDPALPASVKELFSYNPDKSAQLLKEAGYPAGFKTSILLSAASPALIDYYSIIKDYLSKVGVDLKLDIKDNAVFTSMQNARSQEAITPYTTGPAATWWQMAKISGELTNFSYINDPVINTAVVKIQRTVLTDEKEATRLYKDLMKSYVLDQAYVLPDVIGNVYYFWWPWLKNYSGEYTVGYDDPIWPQYIWYDEALKKSMGY